MKLEDIRKENDYAQAPDSGTMLLYTRQGVLMKKYGSKAEAESLLAGKESEQLLELHMFDAAKEFRAIQSESKSHCGIVTHVADFVEDESVYRESIKLEKEFAENGKSIVMLNHLCTKNGMAYVDDYRMIKEGE